MIVPLLNLPIPNELWAVNPVYPPNETLIRVEPSVYFPPPIQTENPWLGYYFRYRDSIPRLELPKAISILPLPNNIPSTIC